MKLIYPYKNPSGLTLGKHMGIQFSLYLREGEVWIKLRMSNISDGSPSISLDLCKEMMFIGVSNIEYLLMKQKYTVYLELYFPL
jgi:hypothetical protein